MKGILLLLFVVLGACSPEPDAGPSEAPGEPVQTAPEIDVAFVLEHATAEAGAALASVMEVGSSSCQRPAARVRWRGSRPESAVSPSQAPCTSALSRSGARTREQPDPALRVPPRGWAAPPYYIMTC